LRHIALDIENDLEDCDGLKWEPTNTYYEEAFHSREEIIYYLKKIRDTHILLEGDYNKPVRCTALIVKGLDTSSIMQTLDDA
jgi:hypothetical protein